MIARARSTPNIALIKYWGNRNDALRLPAADSLSMTLDSPSVEIAVARADDLSVRSLAADGSERTLTDKHRKRFEEHLTLTKQFLRTLNIPDALPTALAITIRSLIPPGIGLASSAAVFSALAKAYAELIKGSIALNNQQISVIARFGSGSAARSMFGGYSALKAGSGDAIDSSCGVQVASEDHWTLHDIVIMPSQQEKEVGSTEGHALAWTSPYYEARLEEMPLRNEECWNAIVQRDFEKLQRVAEEDALDMHHVMQTSTPPLKYLSEVAHRIIRDVTALRETEHIPVLYTMDAGPTVHLICPLESLNAVRTCAYAQKECRVLEAKTGEGAKLLL